MLLQVVLPEESPFTKVTLELLGAGVNEHV